MNNQDNDRQVAENLLKKTFYLKSGDNSNNNFLTKFNIDSKTASKEIRKINQEIESNKTLFSLVINKIKKPFANVFGYIGAFFTGGFSGVVLRRTKKKKKHIIHNAIRIQKGLKKDDIEDEKKTKNQKKNKEEIKDDKIIDNKNVKDNLEKNNLKDPLLNIGDNSIEEDEYEEENVKQPIKNDNEINIDNEKKEELRKKKTADYNKIHENIKENKDIENTINNVKTSKNCIKNYNNNEEKITTKKENILKDAFSDKKQNNYNNDKKEEKNNNTLLFSNLKESRLENNNQNYSLNNAIKPDKKKDNNLNIV